jgi:hypothetical protein
VASAVDAGEALAVAPLQVPHRRGQQRVLRRVVVLHRSDRDRRPGGDLADGAAVQAGLGDAGDGCVQDVLCPGDGHGTSSRTIRSYGRQPHGRPAARAPGAGPRRQHELRHAAHPGVADDGRQLLVRQHLLYLAVVGPATGRWGWRSRSAWPRCGTTSGRCSTRRPCWSCSWCSGWLLVVFALLPRRWRPAGRPGRARVARRAARARRVGAPLVCSRSSRSPSRR